MEKLRILLLSPESNPLKQKEFQKEKVAKKIEGHVLYFLFDQDSKNPEAIKKVIKEKKVKRVVHSDPNECLKKLSESLKTKKIFTFINGSAIDIKHY